MIAAPDRPRRLLLVSYYFPPITSSGVFRPLRWACSLPQQGWDVTVLSVTDRVRLPRDPALAQKIPESVQVVRTPTLELRSLFIGLNRLGLSGFRSALERRRMSPDDQQGWTPFATRRGRRLLTEIPHDVIVSTSAPYSAHVVGGKLASASGLPWVVDLRDEWSLHEERCAAYPTPRHAERDRRREIAALTDASLVISVSQPYLDRHRSLVPDEPAEKFRVLTNGYEENDYPEPPAGPPDRFRIAYTGIVYRPLEIATFLEGLRLALATGRVDPRSTEVVLAGHGLREIDTSGLPEGLVRVLGHRPQHEMPQILRDAAVLLLVPTPIPGNYPGKLFPYLAAGRPILVIGTPDDSAANLVSSTRSGTTVAPDDPQGVADALAQLFSRWKAGESLADQDRGAIREFGAQKQAATLSKWLDAVVVRSSG